MGALIGLAAVLPPGTALAVTPVSGSLPPATQTTINNGPGDQTDPHVSGDLVSYSAQLGGGTQIRYFTFADGTDAGISGTTGFDFLSDVTGSTIAFTRLTNGRGAIYSFDVATSGPAVELDPQPSSNRRGVGIGDGTVAWIDFSTVGGEPFAYDRVSGAPSQRLTNDERFDRRPQVSPDGSVIVWESCAQTGAGCDVHKAVKSGGSWSVGAVANTSDEESNPDTNGSVVVYSRGDPSVPDSIDIYWTPVAGGAETRLEVAGEQNNPAISGDLVVFESQAVGSTTTDLFAYRLSANTLYQLTNTAGLSEVLSDVSVSPSGQVRVVWAVFEQDENVYGLTFQPPSSTTMAVQFLQPLDQSTDPQNPVINTGKNGRVIPVKVQLSESGAALTDQNAPGPVTIGVSHMSSCASGSTDSVESYADAGNSSAGTNEFSYDPAIPGWKYNLDTKALGLATGECYRIDVAVNGTKVTKAFTVFRPTK